MVSAFHIQTHTSHNIAQITFAGVAIIIVVQTNISPFRECRHTPHYFVMTPLFKKKRSSLVRNLYHTRNSENRCILRIRNDIYWIVTNLYVVPITSNDLIWPLSSIVDFELLPSFCPFCPMGVNAPRPQCPLRWKKVWNYLYNVLVQIQITWTRHNCGWNTPPVVWRHFECCTIRFARLLRNTCPQCGQYLWLWFDLCADWKEQGFPVLLLTYC